MLWPHCSPPEVGLAAAPLEALRAALHHRIASGLEQANIFAVLRDGRLPFVHVGGHEQAPSLNALFRLYSMTKPFVATVFLMLLDEGRVSLDDTLATYLPAFEAPHVLNEFLPNRKKHGSLHAVKAHVVAAAEKDIIGKKSFDSEGITSALSEPLVCVPALRPITLRMLLTHTSGLGYGPGIEYQEPRNKVQHLYAELCRKTEAGHIPNLCVWVDQLAEIPLLFQPGERFHYSYSMDVLGRVLEVVTGMELAECLKSRLFVPMQMINTGFAVPEDQAHCLLDLQQLSGKEVTRRRAGATRRVLGGAQREQRCLKTVDSGNEVPT